MSVYARSVRSTPQRSTSETWNVIIDLLAPSAGAARDELSKVSGIAASVIASEGPKDVPIVVRGGGPQVRIRCLYDEDATNGDSANEDKFPKCPTEGDWSLSLPTPDEDLAWVKAALAKKSSRIKARAISDPIPADDEESDRTKSSAATIDPEAFFRS